MDDPPPKLLLTGPSGCGKTTLVRKVIQQLEKPAAGFFTEEVRGSTGQRIGFDVVLLDGRRGPLARVGIKGPRVGKYGVDLLFLEEVALAAMEPEPDTLIVIDEIGKMECFSRPFVETVKSLLFSPRALLGTVALGGSSFIREVRNSPGVELIEVTPQNREGLVGEIVGKLRIES